MPTAVIVVMTTCRPRCCARTSRAWRCDIGMASLRDQGGGGAALPVRSAIRRREFGGPVPAIEQRVRDSPGLQDRLGENRARIAALAFVQGVPTAYADKHK